MQIKKIHVKNIGLFNNLDVCFNNKFNFITGPNSSGKTSILRYIALCLSHKGIKQFRYRSEAEIWLDFGNTASTKRVGYSQDWISNYDIYQSATLKSWTKPLSTSDEELLTPNDLTNKYNDFAPLFISAFRKISYVKVQGMTQEQNRPEQLNNYRTNGANLLDGQNMPNVKQWLINRYFQIEKSWAINEKKNWQWLLENLSIIGPIGSNLKFEEIKRDLEPIFSVFGQKCYLEELSSGYQSILSTIFCIFDWIEGTNEGKDMLVKNAEGTVLIDELDAHLHPEWQLTIRDSLESLFPKLQFIITTHSPHLIASAKSKELLIIPEHKGSLDLYPSSKTYSGWNTDQILEEIMGVKSLTNKLYAELIKECLNLIDTKDIKQLDKAIKKLKTVSHSNDTIVESFEIKLATLKLRAK